MLYQYGITQQGTYHIEHDLVCQDAHFYRKINDRFAIAAVADGLGSELHSDVASKIASESAVTYCAEHIEQDSLDEVILQVIKESFRYALNEIGRVVEERGDDESQYDTTLALAVFKNGTVYYGNSGDSGIVALRQDGCYEALTEQQRDENNCVFPLCFGADYWVFGKKEAVSSVLLATDGILETFFPFLLRDEEVNIYVALIQCFMDESKLRFEQEGEEAVQQKMARFVASIPGNQVNDDKTVLVMVDTDIPAATLPEPYYQVPDWPALKKKRDEQYRRAAYPGMYAMGQDAFGNRPKESIEEQSEKSSFSLAREEATVLEKTSVHTAPSMETAPEETTVCSDTSEETAAQVPSDSAAETVLEASKAHTDETHDVSEEARRRERIEKVLSELDYQPTPLYKNHRLPEVNELMANAPQQGQSPTKVNPAPVTENRVRKQMAASASAVHPTMSQNRSDDNAHGADPVAAVNTVISVTHAPEGQGTPKDTVSTDGIVLDQNRIIITCGDGDDAVKERVTVMIERWYQRGKHTFKAKNKIQKWTKQ